MSGGQSPVGTDNWCTTDVTVAVSKRQLIWVVGNVSRRASYDSSVQSWNQRYSGVPCTANFVHWKIRYLIIFPTSIMICITYRVWQKRKPPRPKERRFSSCWISAKNWTDFLCGLATFIRYPLILLSQNLHLILYVFEITRFWCKKQNLIVLRHFLYLPELKSAILHIMLFTTNQQICIYSSLDASVFL